MSITVQITGTEQLIQALRRFTDPEMLRTSVGGALFQEAEAIMADSKENYVPVDTGTLKSSGHVQEPTIEQNRSGGQFANGWNISVTMGYGGAAKDYALAQHERLDYQHPTGGPKYLERPLIAAASGLAGRLAARIRGMFT